MVRLFGTFTEKDGQKIAVLEVQMGQTQQRDSDALKSVYSSFQNIVKLVELFSFSVHEDLQMFLPFSNDHRVLAISSIFKELYHQVLLVSIFLFAQTQRRRSYSKQTKEKSKKLLSLSAVPSSLSTEWLMCFTNLKVSLSLQTSASEFSWGWTVNSYEKQHKKIKLWCICKYVAFHELVKRYSRLTVKKEQVFASVQPASRFFAKQESRC